MFCFNAHMGSLGCPFNEVVEGGEQRTAYGERGGGVEVRDGWHSLARPVSTEEKGGLTGYREVKGQE